MRTKISLTALACAFVLTGCASHHAIHFAAAAPVAGSPAPARLVLAAAPDEVEPAQPAEIQVHMDHVSDTTATLLDQAREQEPTTIALAQHVPEALSFHCTQGEESLGCAARPAAHEESSNDSHTDQQGE